MAVIKNSNIVLSSDIGSVLNAAGGSVNINQPATFFTSAANINPAAKWKPTQYAADFDDSNYWKAYDGSCQIDIKYAVNNSEYVSDTPVKQVKTMFLNGNTGWTFKYWSANQTYPHRLGDFRNYKTGAHFDAVVGSHSPASVISNDWYPVMIGMNLAKTSVDGNELKLTDIQYKTGSYISGFYQAMMYWTDSSEGATLVGVGSPDSSDRPMPYNHCISVHKDGIYYLCAVLCTDYISTPRSSIGGGGVIIPHPGSDIVAVNVTVGRLVINVESTSTMIGDPNSYNKFQPRIQMTIAVKEVMNYECAWFFNPIKSDGTIMYDITLVDQSLSPINYTQAGEYRYVDYGTIFTTNLPGDITISGFKGVCQSQVTGEMIEFTLPISWSGGFG